MKLGKNEYILSSPAFCGCLKDSLTSASCCLQFAYSRFNYENSPYIIEETRLTPELLHVLYVHTFSILQQIGMKKYLNFLYI